MPKPSADHRSTNGAVASCDEVRAAEQLARLQLAEVGFTWSSDTRPRELVELVSEEAKRLESSSEEFIRDAASSMREAIAPLVEVLRHHVCDGSCEPPPLEEGPLNFVVSRAEGEKLRPGSRPQPRADRSSMLSLRLPLDARAQPKALPARPPISTATYSNSTATSSLANRHRELIALRLRLGKPSTD
jgi:hypothetical protein